MIVIIAIVFAVNIKMKFLPLTLTLCNGSSIPCCVNAYGDGNAQEKMIMMMIVMMIMDESDDNDDDPSTTVVTVPCGRHNPIL